MSCPLRRAACPLGLLLRRRRVAARRAGAGGGRARLRRARADRPRRPLGRDGVRAGLPQPGRAPDRRRRDDRVRARAPGTAIAPHPARRGRHRLAQPLPARHRGPCRTPGRIRIATPSPRAGAGRARAPRRGPRLPLGLRSRRGAGGDLRRAERPGAEVARSAELLGTRLARAFGRDRFRVELQRPMWRHDRARNRWLERLAERLGVPCVATGNVHMHQRRRAALQDALVAVRLRGSLEETEPQRRGNSSSHLASPAEAAERFREHPEAVAETRRLAERLRFDLDQRPRLQLSRLRGSRRRLAAWPRSARSGSSTATRGPPSTRRQRRLDDELGADPAAAALRLLPPALRHPRARARGRGRGPRARLGADAAAARPGPGLERQLDRLLPHRPLAHRPRAKRALPRALPQRGDHRGPRHRPRLPARHPRPS